MFDETKLPAGGEGESGGEGETLRSLRDPNSPLWANAAVEDKSEASETEILEVLDKTVHGITESGAKVTATYTDHTRKVFTQAMRDGTFVPNWRVTKRNKGTEVSLKLPSDEDEHRELVIYLPDEDLVVPEGAVTRPKEIRLKTPVNDMPVRPEDSVRFNPLLEEIEYYLSEPIEWDEFPANPALDE